MTKYYSKTHEWVMVDGEEAVVGVAEYIAREVGDITYVELPKEGSDLIVGDTIGVIESVQESSDVLCPMSGTVVAVNKYLNDDAGLVSISPEDKGWMCRLDNINLDELDDLMTEEQYKKYLRSL